MAYEFTKLSDLPLVDEFPEGGTVLINDNGDIKQCASDGLGGGNSGITGGGNFIINPETMGVWDFELNNQGSQGPLSLNENDDISLAGYSGSAGGDNETTYYQEKTLILSDDIMNEIRAVYEFGGNVKMLCRDSDTMYLEDIHCNYVHSGRDSYDLDGSLYWDYFFGYQEEKKVIFIKNNIQYNITLISIISQSMWEEVMNDEKPTDGPSTPV